MKEANLVILWNIVANTATDSMNEQMTDADFKKRIDKFRKLLNKIIKEGKQL